MRISHTILSFLIALLLLLSLALTVLANGGSEIRVTVPAEHTVTVLCGSGGRITVDNTDYTGENSFTVKRHGDFTLTAHPDSGFELVSVSGNNICQMLFDGNSATLIKISEDTAITALFRAQARRDIPVGIFVPVSSNSGSIAAEAEITDDEANITLSKADFDEFLNGDAGADTVSVDISNVGVDIHSVVIPASTVRAIADKSNDNENPPEMELLLPHSEITFDSAALTSIAEQAGEDSVTLRVETLEAEALTTAQQAAISDTADNRVIVSITLKGGENSIRDFKGGSSSIRLPYTPKPGENTETVTVWYVSADGDMEEIPCRFDNGFVNFTVFHLSDYIIKPGVIEAVENHCFVCELFGRNIAPWCIVLTVLAFVAVLITVAVLLLAKRKKHN